MATRRSPESSRPPAKPVVTAAEKTAAAPETPKPKRASKPRTPSAQSKAATTAKVEITPDMRRGMIAEAAYLRAERRGFTGSNEMEDWLSAEAEVDALLRAGGKAQ